MAGPFIRSILRFLFVPVLISGSICGAEPAKPYSGKFPLDEIVVEDKRPALEKTGRVRVITAEEMDSRGVRTLDEALQMVPGLVLRVGSGGIPRIDIRGMRSRHVLILLDGVPLNSTFDGQMDPRMIPVEIIRKIKVTYGTGSSLYNSGALGGVINIITRRGESKKSFFIQEETSPGTRHDGRIRASGSDGALDYFLGLSEEQRDGFPLADGFTATPNEDGDTRENSGLRRASMLLRLGYTPSERWQWGLTYGQHASVYGLPPSTLTDTANDPFANKARYERVLDQDGRFFQIISSYDARGPWEYRFWYYQNSQNEETANFDDALYAGMTNAQLNGTSHQFGRTLVRGQTFQAIRTVGGEGTLTFGLTNERDDWSANGGIHDLDVTKAGAQKKTYSVRRFEASRDLAIQTLAVEYACRPANRLELTVGGDLCRQFKDDDSKDSQGEYTVALSREVGERTRIHGSFARKIRFPAIQQLYDETSGNGALKPERALNSELGITHTTGRKTDLGLTFFHSAVDDYIEKDNTTNRYENYEEYLFKGIELTACHRFRRPLTLEAGVTFMDSEDRTAGSGRDELQFRPSLKLTGAAVYKARSGFQTRLELLHLDGQKFYSRTTPLQKRDLNAITVTNLRLASPIRRTPLTVYLGANNLFDRDYETAYGVPAPGRFVYSGVQGLF